MKLTPKPASQLLAACIQAQLNTLLVGAPGVGKTSIGSQVAKMLGADVVFTFPGLSDPTDAKGLPWVIDGKAHFLPFGDLDRLLNATSLTLWFIDDFGQGTPAVQASYMQWLLARQVNGHRLPDCVSIIAASNRRTDKSGVSGILEAVKSRFATIIEIVVSVDDWCEWAIGNGVPVELIAFIRLRPELIHKFEPTADLVNQPSPRTWANAGRILALGLPGADIEFAALAGAVGEGAATELVGFLKAFREMPNLDGILTNPDTAEIPGSPSGLYAVATGLAYRASVANFGRVLKYAERLHKAQQGDFAALLVKDSLRRKKDLANTHDYVRFACGPTGKLIAGVAA